MIIFGIALCIVGLFVLLFSWRGRVVARGQYCRKCRFDLAGLDIDTPESKCPECGSEIHEPTARRGVLRRRSRVGFGIACLLLFVGVGVSGLGAAGKTKAFVAAMPDPIVLWLTDLGVDEALDELHTRTSKVPNTMSAKDWDHAIRSGLAFQADTSLVWDIGWGQVLFDALNFNQMSDKEVEQYFTAGITHDLMVRDRVHPGTNILPNNLHRSQKRMDMISGGITEYVFRSQITACGILNEDPFFEQDLYTSNRNIALWGGGYNNSSRSNGTYGFKEIFDKAPGEEIQLQYEYTVRLDHGDTLIFEKHFSETITVSIIDPNEPVVRIIKDDVLSKSVFDMLFMKTFQITQILAEPVERGRGAGPNSILIATDAIPMHISLQFYLMIDRTEIKIGTASNSNTSNSNFGGWLSLNENRRNGISSELANEIHAKLLKQETVMIVARTDSALMIKEPNVNEVLGINIFFENVPIEIVDRLDPGGSVGADDTRVKPTRFESYGDRP